MLAEHPDAQLIALGIEYERFASDCDKLDNNPPSDFEQLAREEDRLAAEGLRFLQQLRTCTAQTPEVVAMQLLMVGHCNRWAGTTSAKRAQEGESVADVIVWQIVAALPAIFKRLGISAYAGGRLEACGEAIEGALPFQRRAPAEARALPAGAQPCPPSSSPGRLVSLGAA